MVVAGISGDRRKAGDKEEATGRREERGVTFFILK
jgi:hypothetical protein